MLYDAYGRRIRKRRLYGFALTPATEPDLLRSDTDRSGGCDAIGYLSEDVEPEEDQFEILLGKKEIKCAH